MLYLAGIYNQDNRFVVLTTAANKEMNPFHHRMPVILSEDELEPWVYSHI